MIAAKCHVVTAQHDFRFRPDFANIFYYLLDALVPICHHRLDKNEIERLLFCQKILKHTARQTESPKVSRNCFQTHWTRDLCAVKSPPAPPVGFKLLSLSCERGQSVEIIEKLKFSPATQIPCDAQQPVGFYPEIISGKVIYRRIYKQDFHLSIFYV